jgi:Na+/H+ antiporter NhaD/arsenite permease-like protein
VVEIKTMMAIIIFLVAYVMIVSEKVHRTVVGIVGGILVILCGILTQEKAIGYIDFNTLGLLIGMMIIVNITTETGLFNFLAIWSAKKVKAKPVALLVVLSTLTMLCSAFLDNVTTVLFIVPITLSITTQLHMEAKPFLISQIISSNIGGAATLIGDPPNIMIGSAVGLDFIDFIGNVMGINLFIFVVVMVLLVVVYRKQLHTTPALQDQIMKLQARKQISQPGLLKKCLFVLCITIAFFIFHTALHLETATVALTGAGLLLLISCTRDEGTIVKVLSKVEWTTIFFFAGLFVLVGGLVETGVIRDLAVKAMQLTQGNLTAVTILVLWMSAIASAFVDNIPFVATMIPLIRDMGNLGITQLDPLWWSLSLGACLGGNGTLIGASANVVVASMAAKRGKQISFMGYMKIAFPITILSVLISSVYVYWRYL